MMKHKSRNNQRLLAALTFGFFVFCLGYMIISSLPISTHVKTTMLGLAYLIPGILAFTACFYVRAKVDSNDRLTWLYLGLAVLLLSAGEVIWVYYEIVKGMAEPPYPSLADYFYLSSYPFLFLVFVSMSNFRDAFHHIHIKIRALLDVSIIMLISAIGTWQFLAKPILQLYPDSTVMETVMNVVYPAADLAIIFAVAVNMLGFKTSKWRSWEKLLAIGLAILGATDIIFSFFAAADIYFTENLWASVLDIGWLTAYFLFFMGAISALINQGEIKLENPLDQSPHSRWQDTLVPAALVPTIPMLIYLSQSAPTFDFWVIVSVATIISLIIGIRASIMVAESRMFFTDSVTDSVTGLYNHRFFQDRLSAELARADRHGETLSLVVLDLDDFSDINNVHGHPTGDSILFDTGGEIVATIRSSDLVCRTGGDEFAIIMPHTKPDHAYKASIKIQEALKSIAKNKEFKVSASIGIASFPQHAYNRNELEKRADGALYWSKFHGKSQITIFDSKEVRLFDVEERLRTIASRSHHSTLKILAEAIDARDPQTRDHSIHVSTLAKKLAKEIFGSGEKLELIETAALLHDIGKIGIPNEILEKPGKLTDEERAKIQEHSRMSQNMLTQTAMQEIIPWILAHHENWDGTGYPEGLKGEQIPTEARILSICDAYDAMISDRPYRKGMTQEEAFRELRAGKATQFDSNLVEKFIHVATSASQITRTA